MAQGAGEVGTEAREREAGLEGGAVGACDREGEGVESVSHLMKCETL